MLGAIDEIEQGVDVPPDGHVDDHVVAQGPEGGCIAALALQAPNESWAFVGDCIDPFERSYEFGQLRVGQRREELGGIELGDVKIPIRHESQPVSTAVAVTAKCLLYRLDRR